MFGSLGGAASADLAMEAFQDDLKVTGRSVRLFCLQVKCSD